MNCRFTLIYQVRSQLIVWVWSRVVQQLTEKVCPRKHIVPQCFRAELSTPRNLQ